jgi:hypothetical protein
VFRSDPANTFPMSRLTLISAVFGCAPLFHYGDAPTHFAEKVEERSVQVAVGFCEERAENLLGARLAAGVSDELSAKRKTQGRPQR